MLLPVGTYLSSKDVVADACSPPLAHAIKAIITAPRIPQLIQPFFILVVSVIVFPVRERHRNALRAAQAYPPFSFRQSRQGKPSLICHASAGVEQAVPRPRMSRSWNSHRFHISVKQTAGQISMEDMMKRLVLLLCLTALAGCSGMGAQRQGAAPGSAGGPPGNDMTYRGGSV
ncbi:hypothetical protein [Noviherbaspirillum galbum]|uniref:Lipoprotein n=1 Tax=Noviherbaspirillum galbum TaxID=2709383 RepID=A0A6B3SY84_9BURK|nr:hypothetical protein [Noviherbaspirillum galbum]NEX63592.1 hypothetical protein [Noviherbaspirillum galbum]